MCVGLTAQWSDQHTPGSFAPVDPDKGRASPHPLTLPKTAIRPTPNVVPAHEHGPVRTSKEEPPRQ
jgi:hypothetical protein